MIAMTAVFFLMALAMVGACVLWLALYRAIRRDVDRARVAKAHEKTLRFRAYLGKAVVDRATGRVGVFCCLQAQRKSRWHAFEFIGGMTLANGEHHRFDAEDVRLAIEREREQFRAERGWDAEHQ